MNENNVSANTVIHRHANIRKALQYAFKTGLIDINPADRIERPKKVKYVGSTYNDQGSCSVSCHFEAIHRREIRIIYTKRNGFLTSFEMTDGATE